MGYVVYDTQTIKINYIDENFTLSLEAVLMKKRPCKSKRDWRKLQCKCEWNWWI